MIKALKISADRTALCGVAKPMTFRAASRDVIGDREGGQRAACDQHLPADRDEIRELRRIGVEVDQIGRFLGPA
jgi:hypothetical protein